MQGDIQAEKTVYGEVEKLSGALEDLRIKLRPYKKGLI